MNNLHVDLVDKFVNDVMKQYHVIEKIDVNYHHLNDAYKLHIVLKAPLNRSITIPLSNFELSCKDIKGYFRHVQLELEACVKETVFEAAQALYKGHNDHNMIHYWNPKPKMSQYLMMPPDFTINFEFESKLKKDIDAEFKLAQLKDKQNAEEQFKKLAEETYKIHQYTWQAPKPIHSPAQNKLIQEKLIAEMQDITKKKDALWAPDPGELYGPYYTSKAGNVSQLKSLMPGLYVDVKCPKCNYGSLLWNTVQHLNDIHKMPILEIADWTESLDKEKYQLEIKGNDVKK